MSTTYPGVKYIQTVIYVSELELAYLYAKFFFVVALLKMFGIFVHKQEQTYYFKFG